MSQLSFVASAISSIINSPVKTYDECVKDGLKIDPSQILDLDTIYKKSLPRIDLKDIIPPKETTYGVNLVQIFVKTLEEDSQSMFVDPSITVLELKDAIYAKFGSDRKTMRLTFNGKQLDDSKTLASYDIQKGCTIQVLSKVVGGYDFYVVRDNLLSPSFDYDFINLSDNGATFVRGMEVYKRPYGWKRIAFNVEQYGTDRTWLGSVGVSPYEWPVSYHGTRVEYIENIVSESYRLGVRFAYGVGIYTSPEINIAEQYSREFDRYNARWKVVLQNRVNPVRLRKCNNNNIWVVPRDEDIRPYGLCIKRVCDI
jgi:hypothetical protein